jgi:menaquinone-dependent protoporphyrinogen IX oxidase
MKIWIMHDSVYGNGKRVAERLANKLGQIGNVTIGDVKVITPDQVAKENPDGIIFGSAIRAFQNSINLKKWFKIYSQMAKNENKIASFSAVFVTHASSKNFMTKLGDNALKTLQKSMIFRKVYPEWFSVQVIGQKGPLEAGELEKFDEIGPRLVRWIKS